MELITNYSWFLLTALLLSITPGADTLYIVSRTVSQGTRAGVASVLGISTGSLFHTLCASVGLSAILVKSATAFFVVKWLGALYLFYLGIRMIRNRPSAIQDDVCHETADFGAIYMQGVLTNVLNPKVAIFFLALIPQFIVPAANSNIAPFLILGGTFILTGTIWCLFLVYIANFVGDQIRYLGRHKGLLEKATGVLFVGLAARLAIQEE